MISVPDSLLGPLNLFLSWSHGERKEKKKEKENKKKKKEKKKKNGVACSV